jgi:hypothetical protein
MAMIVKREESEGWEPAPPGMHAAVCVDVVDMGWMRSPWGPKAKIRCVFELALKNEKGMHYRISQMYTPSFHPKSKLRQHLEQWRGRAYTKEEMEAGFDLESLVGKPCGLAIMHKEKANGDLNADITAITPASSRPEISDTYEPATSREGYRAPEFSAFGPSPDAGGHEAPAPAAAQQADPDWMS